jgi:hypothetical protein
VSTEHHARMLEALRAGRVARMRWAMRLATNVDRPTPRTRDIGDEKDDYEPRAIDPPTIESGA